MLTGFCHYAMLILIFPAFALNSLDFPIINERLFYEHNKAELKFSPELILHNGLEIFCKKVSCLSYDKLDVLSSNNGIYNSIYPFFGRLVGIVNIILLMVSFMLYLSPTLFDAVNICGLINEP